MVVMRILFLLFLFSPHSALFNLTLMEQKAIAEKYKRKLVKCFDCWADIRGDYHKQVIRAQHSMSEEVRIFCKKCYKVIARLIKSRVICKIFYFATLLSLINNRMGAVSLRIGTSRVGSKVWD